MLHVVAFSLFAYGAAADNGPAPVAVFMPDSPAGLDLVTVEDGKWEAQTVAGRPAITVISPGTYLYFKVLPGARAKIGSELYLVVDFLDSGLGNVTLEYNTSASPYARGPSYLMADSGEWSRCLLHVADAQLAGLQNAGADFRLAYLGPITISGAALYTTPPSGDFPSNRERMERALKRLPGQGGPRDMYYTFGNDADEASAMLYRALGVTSIESYVTWETCEGAGEGAWDWTHWDRQVAILKENGLKWVPFLILGPAYSTPNWFRASADHFPCRCLEHGIDSKIESRWNPNLPKWIDRFLGEFAKRYRDTEVIESVLLGIQGDFGEAIYSVSGGGWTENVPGPYHQHAGFWCDDPHARTDFQDVMRQRYRRLRKLNRAWGTHFADWDAVDFPARGKAFTAFRENVPSASPEIRRRWLDFVDWYRGAMTEWADWWLAATRKHFPQTPIYLCTGGDAIPEHGSNFAEQCRVAAKYGAGVRITNEGSNYASNFYLTRWVAAAGKHYGAYFGFEPAGAEDERGIVARIYNATASGANQLHDYTPNVVNSTARIEAQRTHLRHLFHVPKPVVPAALWYPNTAMTLKWGEFADKVKQLRDYLDVDYVDETMLHNDALRNYRLLVILHGGIIENDDARRLAAWMKQGGRIVVLQTPQFENVEGKNKPEHMLFGRSPQGRRHGKGAIYRASDWDAFAAQIKTCLQDLELPVYDLKKDEVYCTQIDSNRFLLLNCAAEEAAVAVTYRGRDLQWMAPAGTITDVRVGEDGGFRKSPPVHTHSSLRRD